MGLIIGANSINVGKSKPLIVEELPDSGKSGVIYLVRNEQESGENLYDEYIYINGNWEKIGSFSIELKTVNGESLLGTGNITIDASNKEDKISIEIKDTTISALTTEINKYYYFSAPIENIVITLPTISNTSFVNSIIFYLTGGTSPSIIFTSDSDVYYSNGFGIESGKTYEVNALYNGIAWVVASVEIVTSNS